MNERNEKFREMVNGIYGFLDCDDVDDQKQRLNECMEFMVNLHRSWVDNDKPKCEIR